MQEQLPKDAKKMATEPTKGHEKMSFKAFILPCFSVDSVVILFLDG